MDKATRKLRARNKAQRTPRNVLSPYEGRGLGQKGKPAKSFPSARCGHISGGTLIFVRRTRHDGTMYQTPIRIGGVECLNEAVVARNGVKQCLGHIG